MMIKQHNWFYRNKSIWNEQGFSKWKWDIKYKNIIQQYKND